MAYCYDFTNKYKKAIACLDNIENLEIGTFTSKKDSIKEIKSSVPELRNAILFDERNYLEYQQSLKEEEENKERERAEMKKLMEDLLIMLKGCNTSQRPNNNIPLWGYIMSIVLSIAATFLCCD